MKCVICHSKDIEMKDVNEQLMRGEDLILIPVRVLVCDNCGERYYDRRAIKQLEQVEEEINTGKAPFKRVGDVLRVTSGPASS